MAKDKNREIDVTLSVQAGAANSDATEEVVGSTKVKQKHLGKLYKQLTSALAKWGDKDWGEFPPANDQTNIVTLSLNAQAEGFQTKVFVEYYFDFDAFDIIKAATTEIASKQGWS